MWHGDRQKIQKSINSEIEVSFCGFLIFSAILLALTNPTSHIPMFVKVVVGIFAFVFGRDLVRALIENHKFHEEDK